MREIRQSGSVRGVWRNPYPYRDFPSVVGGDDNLVVYRANCGRRALKLQNEQQVIDQAKRIAAKHK